MFDIQLANMLQWREMILDEPKKRVHDITCSTQSSSLPNAGATNAHNKDNAVSLIKPPLNLRTSHEESNKCKTAVITAMYRKRARLQEYHFQRENSALHQQQQFGQSVSSSERCTATSPCSHHCKSWSCERHVHTPPKMNAKYSSCAYQKRSQHG